MDPTLQSVVIVAMAFVLLEFASSDLGLDLLRVVPASMPRWQSNLTAMMTGQHASEGEGAARSGRRIIDMAVVIGALCSPALVLTRNGADASAITWSVLLELASLLWLIYLLRRPRRPAGEAAAASAGKAAVRKSGSKSRQTRRRR